MQTRIAKKKLIGLNFGHVAMFILLSLYGEMKGNAGWDLMTGMDLNTGIGRTPGKT